MRQKRGFVLHASMALFHVLIIPNYRENKSFLFLRAKENGLFITKMVFRTVNTQRCESDLMGITLTAL